VVVQDVKGRGGGILLGSIGCLRWPYLLDYSVDRLIS
jgi:hypothetical protein